MKAWPKLWQNLMRVSESGCLNITVIVLFNMSDDGQTGWGVCGG